MHADLLQSWRLTFTLPLLNAAERVMSVVAGAGKAAVMNQISAGDARCSLPVALVAPAKGSVSFLVDRAALGMQ
ncbi:MAG: 6-phosphogluconolactonase [Planctomycetota bacterium]